MADVRENKQEHQNFYSKKTDFPLTKTYLIRINPLIPFSFS